MTKKQNFELTWIGKGHRPKLAILDFQTINSLKKSHVQKPLVAVAELLHQTSFGIRLKTVSSGVQ